MKIIIVPVSYCYSDYQNSASERFRCDWLLPYLPADKYNGTQNLDNYDVIIYQKAHCYEMVGISGKYKDKIQIFDTTDPEWLFKERKFLKEIIDNVNFIITSTKSLAEGFEEYNKPVYIIPDRHELSFYKVKKVHQNKRPILVWFGYADNFQRTESLLPIIKERNLDLITICEKPVNYGNFVEWKLDTVNDEIIKGDIVLNLPDQYGLKSDNKTTTAWLLNMPVVERVSDLFRFLDYNERVKESKEKRAYAIENYDIKWSSQEIINLIKETKK